MRKWLRRLVRVELVLILLVIVAGSVVRMTGSGMGCPDWPKCFGYLIPPTERSTLDWHPGRAFKEGNIIIHEEALYSAKADFTAGEQLNLNNWEKYLKHDYAIFNPVHTWIEFLNRLLGALSGLPMLAILVLSFFFLKDDLRIPLLAGSGLFMLGFEAWLGKKVVDGNLIPGSITIHMFGALMIVGILLILYQIVKGKSGQTRYYTPGFRNLLVLGLLLALSQILLGTQVREQVDDLLRMGLSRAQTTESLALTFYVHRSFSILILALNLYLWWYNRKQQFKFGELNAIMILIGLEILLGIILYYFDLPYFAQPAHLLLGALLFAFQLQAVISYYLGATKRVIPVS